MTGNASTPEQKKDFLFRLWRVWCAQPDLRFGQFFVDFSPEMDFYSLEDERTISAMEARARLRPPKPSTTKLDTIRRCRTERVADEGTIEQNIDDAVRRAIQFYSDPFLANTTVTLHSVTPFYNADGLFVSVLIDIEMLKQEISPWTGR